MQSLTLVPKLFIWALVVLLGVVLPDAALASTIKPSGRDVWELYVVGNGYVLFQILNSIKMLMVPDAGSNGFTVLLLFLATVGFLSLAIAAGFDPGKNLIRMFTYIIVVWGVVFFSTKLTVDLEINDRMNPSRVDVLTGVPASVGLPAAVVSGLGKYFTETMEQYFNIGNDASTPFKMASGAVGQFNLFGRMMQEATQYQLTDPELKRTLSTYMNDCVVPAMHMGRLEGTTAQSVPNCPDNKCRGINALMHSSNFVDMLKTAEHQSILTKYYPAFNSVWLADPGINRADFPASDEEANRAARSVGALVSCQTSYRLFRADLIRNTDELILGSANTWSKAGVVVPFETAFRSMLAGAAGPGTPSNSMSSPNGFIMQQGLINSMKGSFRSAAMQTGNNEVMQAAALSQAEAMQTSAWVAGFHMFNNMMGYVYCVLQAFIFAMVPFVIIALMLPGMGKGIFVNYTQILVWLTLWEPMLSIINFIITLFAMESVQGMVYVAGGAMTPAVSGEVSERVNDLIVAAQFLGTMAPLIAWGIVKGALAFTEFISQGVGSAFASQAGASAATGNISMNNMSMDNASMNKFSTQMSSAVGSGSIDAPLHGAALDLKHNLGGTSTTLAGGKAVDLSRTASEKFDKSISQSEAVQEAAQQSKNASVSFSQTLSNVMDKGNSAAKTAALRDAFDIAERNGYTKSEVMAALVQESKSKGRSGGFDASTATNAQLEAEFGLSTGALSQLGLKGGLGGHIGRGASAGAKSGVTGAENESAGTNRTGADGIDYQRVAALTKGGDLSTTAGRSESNKESLGAQTQAMAQELASQIISRSKATTSQLQVAKGQALNMAVSSDVDAQRFNDILDKMEKDAVAHADQEVRMSKDLAAGQKAADTAVADTTAKAPGAGQPVAVDPRMSGATHEAIAAKRDSVGAGTFGRAEQRRQNVQREAAGLNQDLQGRGAARREDEQAVSASADKIRRAGRAETNTNLAGTVDRPNYTTGELPPDTGKSSPAALVADTIKDLTLK